MAARSMWKGSLELGKLQIPIKLFAAVEDDSVHFHLLHERDGVRVRQRMLNPQSGKEAKDGQIAKGYEIRPGTYVLIKDDELASLEPPASRVISVQGFVPLNAIAPAWYDRPYYLGPDGKEQDYFALARVLGTAGRVGILEWVMRKRRYHGALRAEGDHLLVSTLHTEEEVALAPKVAPVGRAADDRELALAEQLIDALVGEFDASAFKNEHRERVLELVDAKARGEQVKLPARPRKRTERALDSALEQSLKQLTKERRSA